MGVTVSWGWGRVGDASFKQFRADELDFNQDFRGVEHDFHHQKGEERRESALDVVARPGT
jgi:hypothetical protein